MDRKGINKRRLQQKTFEAKDVFREYCEYHKIENYFSYPKSYGNDIVFFPVSVVVSNQVLVPFQQQAYCK